MLTSAGQKSLVSVIIPAYDAERSIEATLRSVLAQSYRNIEVIVVDDGSRDRTAAIVDAVRKGDNRVYLVRQPNAGQAAARNAAIAMAKGEFIAPIDADDIWFSDKLSLQVERALQSPEVALVYGWSAFIDERGALTGESVTSDLEGEVLSGLICSNLVGNGSAPLMRAECVRQIGGYDEAKAISGCDDLDLYIRLSERWRFALIPRFVVGYRVSRHNMSLNTWRMIASWETVLLQAQKRNPEQVGKILRWGRAGARLCMAWQSMRGRRHRDVIAHVCAACRHDPLHVLHPTIHWLLRWEMNRVTGLLKRWIGLRSRSSAEEWRSSTPLTLDDLVESMNCPPSTLWERLERRRQAYLRETCGIDSGTGVSNAVARWQAGAEPKSERVH